MPSQEMACELETKTIDVDSLRKVPWDAMINYKYRPKKSCDRRILFIILIYAHRQQLPSTKIHPLKALKRHSDFSVCFNSRTCSWDSSPEPANFTRLEIFQVFHGAAGARARADISNFNESLERRQVDIPVDMRLYSAFFNPSYSWNKNL